MILFVSYFLSTDLRFLRKVYRVGFTENVVNNVRAFEVCGFRVRALESSWKEKQVLFLRFLNFFFFPSLVVRLLRC